ETARGWGFSTPGGARVTIDERGEVVAYCGKVDAGQGNRVALRRLVAAELHTTASAVRMELGDTAGAPYDLGTFGSRSTPAARPALRLAAAATRHALVGAAAARWRLPLDAVEPAGGEIRERTGGRRISFGDLVAAGSRTLDADPDESLAPAPPGL